MTSEILEELQENLKQMGDLIAKQKFTVGDGIAFNKRYFNYFRKMEDLEKSRDNWKKKYNQLKTQTQLNSKSEKGII